MVGRLVVQLDGWLLGCSVGWLDAQLDGWMLSWMVGRLDAVFPYMHICTYLLTVAYVCMFMYICYICFPHKQSVGAESVASF